MQVIFIKDVQGVAKCDEVRNVKDGWAANLLLPRGLAVPATPQHLAARASRVAAAASRGVKTQAKAAGWLKQLKGKSITVSARASAQKTLYAAVGAAALAKAINEQLGVPVEPDHVTVHEHLKTLGEHQIKVNIGGASCAVSVIIKPA